jgi:hypothetical protein
MRSSLAHGGPHGAGGELSCFACIARINRSIAAFRRI